MNGTIALLQLVDLLVEFKYNEAPYSLSLSLGANVGVLDLLLSPFLSILYCITLHNRYQ